MERLGIDLGSHVVRTIGRRGVERVEPALVAQPKGGGRPSAAGQAAIAAVEREPGSYDLVAPLQDGVLVDDDALEALLQHLIRSSRSHRWSRVHLLLTLPTGAPPLTREVMLETALDAGAALVDLIDESLAAGLGVGLPIREPPACGLLDLGASATRAALFAGGQILLSQRLTIGGDAIDREIRDRLEVERSLMVSLAEAESVKRRVGDPGRLEIAGRSTQTGSFASVEVRADWLYETIDLYLRAVEGYVLSILSRAEPDWLQDLGHQGLFLTGGGANLPGLAERLAHRCGFPCRVADEPGSAVALGIMRLMDEL